MSAPRARASLPESPERVKGSVKAALPSGGPPSAEWVVTEACRSRGLRVEFRREDASATCCWVWGRDGQLGLLLVLLEDGPPDPSILRAKREKCRESGIADYWFWPMASSRPGSKEARCWALGSGHMRLHWLVGQILIGY